MIAVVFATRQEAAPLLAALALDPVAGAPVPAYRRAGAEDLVVIGGMGPDAMAAGMRALLAASSVREVINAGICGGLTADAAPGALFRVSTTRATADPAAPPAPCTGGRFAGLPAAGLVTVAEPVFGDARRRELAGASALVDMEGAVVAAACAAAGIPCSFLKAVTDRAGGGGRRELRRNLARQARRLADVLLAELGWPRRRVSFLETLCRFVRIEHTVFSLPLILAGAWLGAGRQWPAVGTLLLLVLVGTGARTLGMAMNRILDRDLDALNPRTVSRELPTGRLGLGGAYLVAALGLAGYLAGCAALGPLCLALSPVPVIPLLAYSLLKRFTSLCHYGIGLCLALGPAGAYVATAGSLPLEGAIVWLCVFVFGWISGFDIIYALQDVAFDRGHGVHSLPVALGPGRAQWAAAGTHLVAVAALAAAWRALGAPPVSGVALLATMAAFASGYWPRVPLPARFFPVSAIAGVGGALVILLGGWR